MKENTARIGDGHDSSGNESFRAVGRKSIICNNFRNTLPVVVVCKWDKFSVQ